MCRLLAVFFYQQNVVTHKNKYNCLDSKQLGGLRTADSSRPPCLILFSTMWCRTALRWRWRNISFLGGGDTCGSGVSGTLIHWWWCGGIGGSGVASGRPECAHRPITPVQTGSEFRKVQGHDMSEEVVGQWCTVSGGSYCEHMIR